MKTLSDLIYILERGLYYRNLIFIMWSATVIDNLPNSKYYERVNEIRKRHWNRNKMDMIAIDMIYRGLY